MNDIIILITSSEFELRMEKRLASIIRDFRVKQGTSQSIQKEDEKGSRGFLPGVRCRVESLKPRVFPTNLT